MVKSYYLLFYKLYRSFEVMAKEGWEHWKAYTFMCLLQILILLQSLVWFTVLTGVTVSLPKPIWIAAPTGALITIINYYALIHEGRWKKWVSEFSVEPKKSRRRASLLSLAFVLAVFAGLILSFVFLSRMGGNP